LSDRQTDFRREWDDVAAEVRAECLEVLTDLRMGEEALAYVKRFRGVPRFPHLSVQWVLDAGVRRRLGVHAGLHCVGIKLVDDLLDGDQPYPARDLGMGVYLVQRATSQFGQYANPAAVLASSQRDFATFWRVQLDEMRRPPETREEWLACASIKSGLLIASYAEMACLAGDVPDSVAPSRTFSQCMGTLVMIADDLVDYVKLGQRDGNLGHFLRTGRVSLGEIHEMVETLRADSRQALRQAPTAYALDSVVDDFADDVLDHHIKPFE
jgi:hypothetical protein